MRTQTQGGWGSEPSGNNPGAYLHEDGRFENSFPSPDYLTVGCGSNKVVLTDAQSVTDYLPCGGPTYELYEYVVDPGSAGLACKNNLVGQLVALTISVTFDDDIEDFGADGWTPVLGDMYFNTGPFEGWTVRQILDSANLVIGGCLNTYEPKEFTWTVSAINENFVDGTKNNGLLTCYAIPLKQPGTDDAYVFSEEAMLIAYPNPFSRMTTIEFAAVEDGRVKLEILDVAGAVVDVLYDGPAGRGIGHKVQLNSEKLQPGTYLCKLKTGRSLHAIRVVVLK
jgi:hypothetical protein